MTVTTDSAAALQQTSRCAEHLTIEMASSPRKPKHHHKYGERVRSLNFEHTAVPTCQPTSAEKTRSVRVKISILYEYCMRSDTAAEVLLYVGGSDESNQRRGPHACIFCSLSSRCVTAYLRTILKTPNTPWFALLCLPRVLCSVFSGLEIRNMGRRNKTKKTRQDGRYEVNGAVYT